MKIISGLRALGLMMPWLLNITTGLRLQLPVQTLEILHPVLRLGWEDDLLCTFVNRVCTGHLGCSVAVRATSATFCREQLTLTSLRLPEVAYDQTLL